MSTAHITSNGEAEPPSKLTSLASTNKDRELGDALAEIKSLRNSERLKEKAVEELTDELNKVDEKLKATEALLESKNLEIKKINDEKKAALAAQFAAEATLRRVHAAQKDDEMPPIEVAKLQDDNRALDRLTKSKEAALLEVERTVQIALAKASLVDDLQNKNQELMKQIEICQEENKILDKMHRQKVAEVEKLTQTVRELEEAVLAGGAAANAVRDYQRKVQEMNEERKTLEREVARAKVTANRVATVVANEWKDANDKVMPLRDKLAIAERTAKAEAQLKLVVNQLEPLTEQQLVGIYNLQQSSQQAEDALSQGMEALQQSMVETLANGSPGPSGSSGNMANYMGQMAMAMGRLGTLEGYLRQGSRKIRDVRKPVWSFGAQSVP
uniref:DOG1 domain-containing protein n=1 Tax=Fagus sylvatica TaxID=28930 RepID=A0A2N9GMW8_FAGSY